MRGFEYTGHRRSSSDSTYDQRLQDEHCNWVQLTETGSAEKKQLSYRRATAQHAMSVETFSAGAWPWNSLKVIGNSAIRWAISHFLLVASSTNVAILHRLTTFTVYVSASDLEKSFNLDTNIEITRRVCFPIRMLTCRILSKFKV